MCLAIPVRLKEKLSEALGVFEYAGVTRDVNLQLLDDVAVGDFVLVHAGFAIERLDEAEAQKTLALMREMSLLQTEDGPEL